MNDDGQRSSIDRVYLPRIDTLRALAALDVVYIHYFSMMVPASIRFVPDGVQLFFVLSGFLITRTLLIESRSHARRDTLRSFYIRRIFRIFPAYYATLAAGLVLGLYGFRQSWPWAMTYTLNFFTSLKVGDAGYAGHLWTLAVEEQFYLVLPCILLFLPRSGFVVTGVLAILGATAYRLVSFPTSETFTFNTLASVDKLSVGVLAALAVEAYGASRVEAALRWMLPLSLPSFLLCSSMPMLSWHMFYLAFGAPMVLCSAFFAWLIVKAAKDGSGSSSWGGTVLPKLGAMSYGIYLFHLPMRAAVEPFERAGPSFLLRCAALALTLIFAFVSFRFFEGPLMRFGRRLIRTTPIQSFRHRLCAAAQ